jgi:hypothetical protein
MKKLVRAKKKLFYGGVLRKVGSVFEINDESHFSNESMEPASKPAPKVVQDPEPDLHLSDMLPEKVKQRELDKKKAEAKKKTEGEQ